MSSCEGQWNDPCWSMGIHETDLQIPFINTYAFLWWFQPTTLDHTNNQHIAQVHTVQGWLLISQLHQVAPCFCNLQLQAHQWLLSRTGHHHLRSFWPAVSSGRLVYNNGGHVCLHGIVFAWLKWSCTLLVCVNSHFLFTDETECYILYMRVCHWYRSLGVSMWTVVVAWRLAFAASLFTVPVSPSHVFLPWLVAKKCPSACWPKSSSWNTRLQKIFKKFYSGKLYHQKSRTLSWCLGTAISCGSILAAEISALW